jgi:hypothetical protein
MRKFYLLLISMFALAMCAFSQEQTSALSSDGIDDLFYHCAQKVINPKYDYNAQETQAKMTYEHNQNKKGTKLSANQPAPKKDCNC